MTCIIRDMGECNCGNGGNCWADTRTQRAIERADRSRALRTIQAKQNAYRVMLVALTVASLCAFAGASWNTLKNMERQHELQARI